jgi:ADP-ribosyltransferase exoenzyme
MATTRPAAPTSPIGHSDVLWGLPGQGGMLTEWAESVPDLTWPESIRTFGRMRRDPKLTAVLAAFNLPILRATWAVDPAGVKEAKAVELVAADLGLPILGEKGRPEASPVPGFRWHDHVRLALLKLVYGHMPFEQWFVQRDGMTHLAGLEERQPHTIAMIDLADNGQIREVLQNTQDKPIPARRLLWYSQDREGANWAGVSLLRSCYSPWVIKHEVMRVHATSHRRWGMGVPVVNAPPGATPAQITEAQKLAAGMRAGDQAGAGLPAGFSFQLAGISGSVPDAVGFLNFLNQEMAGSALAKVIELGSTSEGSRALGDTFLDLFLLALQAAADAIGDAATWGEPAMPGVSRALTEYNFGEGEACPRIVASDVGDRHEVTATALQLLLASGAIVADEGLEAFVREAWALPKRTTPRPAVPPAGVQPPARPGLPPGPGRPGPGQAPGGAGAQAPPAQPPPPAPAPARPAPGPPGRRGGQPATAAAGRIDGLARDLTQLEAAAGLDPVAIRQETDTAADHVLARWAPILTAQRQDLADQVTAAVDDGRIDKLAALGADPAAAATLLYGAMRDVAARAAARMLGEAAAQGVDIDPAHVQVDEDRLRQIAEARAGLAAAQMARHASTKALQVVASAGTDAARQVTAVLAGLSPTSLADELRAAMHAAVNAGRFAVLAAAPDASYVASEILDTNTCLPCRDMDGHTFASLADARAAYANGGYVDCDGGARCRGTVVAAWPQPPEPGTPESYEEGLYGELGRHLGPSAWRDIGLAGTAADAEGPPPFGDAPDLAAAVFREQMHPRDRRGRFARKPGGPAGQTAPARRPAGRRPYPPGAPSFAPATLTRTEKWAIGAYTTPDGTRDINDPLRQGRPLRVLKTAVLNIDDNVTVRALDRAIAKSTVAADGVLYRGVARRVGTEPWQPGDEFTDLGYSSTTSDPGRARAFAGIRAAGNEPGTGRSGLAYDPFFKPTGGEPVVLAVHLAAGQHAVPGDLSVEEFILPRGITYHVTGRSQGPGGPVVDVEVTEP